MRLTAVRAMVRGWLLAVYRHRFRAGEVVSDYKAVAKDHALFVADLARFCCVFDSTYDADNPDTIKLNEGKRLVWLHFQAMAQVQLEDLPQIQRRTETDE